MFARETIFPVKRTIRSNRARLKSAAASVVERLEPRQLLSVVTTYPVPGASADTWDGSSAHIIAGPNGNYWFTDPTDNAIGEVTPAGQVTMFPLPVHNAPLDDGSGGVGPDDASPMDVIVGPNGSLWFTENGVDRIGEITPAGVITEFKTPTTDSNPAGLAVGSDGDIWFAEQNNDAIARITPAGKITEFALSTLDVSSSDGMAEGSDGNVWFVANDNNGNGVVASITPTGTVTSYPLSDNPTTIAAGADGNLWVGCDDGVIDQVTTAGTVTSFNLPDGAGVNSLQAGTDGNLWFTTDGNNPFGKITTSGVISEFAFPTTGGDANDSSISPNDLTQGADGSLWFIDASNPQVGTINLTGALLASSDSVTVTAGTTATSTFASFTDFSGASTASDYTATLTLSDGSTLADTIAANTAGGFDVTASNDWVVGNNSVTVTITDTRDSTRVATATASVDATAPTATGTGLDVSAQAGQLVTGTVATFTGVALNSLSQYSASIDWGDGHDTEGTVTANSTGGFDISGSNRYADSGTYTVTTTLSPYPGGVYLPGPISVDPIKPIPTPVTGGSTGSVGSTTAHTTATTAPATFISPPSTKALAKAGIATGLPSIVPIGGDGGAVATSTATIAAGAMNGTGYSVQATSTAAFTGTVADFALTNPSYNLSNLSATVTWNDPGIRDWYFTLSNSPTAGTISPDGNGGFNVGTTASFSSGGLYHFVVTITDGTLGTGDAAIVGVAYGQIIVDRPIIWLPILTANAPTAAGGAVPGSASAVSGSQASNPVLGQKVKPINLSIRSIAGQTFTGQVGAASGLVAGKSNLTNLQGTIHWGDGTTSPAIFVGGNTGHVAVRGSHTYASPGDYSVTVSATESLTANGTASSLYPLELPTMESAARIVAPPKHSYITTGGIAITAVAGTAFTSPVASFAAPALATGVVRVATIAWGDGTHSAGAITTDSSGQITVTASHTYKKKGKYIVWVAVNQKPAPGTSRKGIKVTKVLAMIKTSAVVSPA